MYKKYIALILGLALGVTGYSGFTNQAFAAASVTSSATTAISSDSAVGSSIALPSLALTEGLAGDIATGTLVWMLPAGFFLDTSTPASVSFAGTGLAGSSTVSFPDNTHFSLVINSTSSIAGSITIGSTTPLRVKASSGSAMALPGNITLSSGTVAGITTTTNFGTLTQIPGAPKKLAFTIQPSASIAAGAVFPATQVTVQDQFSNRVDTDNGRNISLAAVNATNTSLSASMSLSGTTVINDTLGISNFTTLSYPVAENIRLSATATSLETAFSNSIAVTATSTPPPPPVNLPNGSLVKIMGDPTIYMVINGTLRPFTTPAIFHARGKKFQNVKEISKDAFEHFRLGKPVGNGDDEGEQEDGRPITLPTSTPLTLSSTTLAALAGLPEGTVIKVPGDPTVYLVMSGSLQPVPSIAVFRSWHKRFEDVKEIPVLRLQSLPVGPPVSFAEGTLVKGSGSTVWVISNGQKRGIPSMETFHRHGWSLSSVINANDKEINDLHDSGIED